MATQSSIYNNDGATRTFPSTKHIPTIMHVSVLQKRITDNTWLVVNVNDYTLVENSIIFDVAPDIALYSQIEIRVADDASELTTSPSDIAIVASSIADVTTVAGSIADVTTVVTNIASVQTVSASIANVNTVSSSIANVNTVATNIVSVNTVATNIVDVVAVADNIVPNLAEILLADTNAGIATTQATNAQLSAWEAEAEKLTADSYATQLENVFVNTYTSDGDGTFTSTPTTEYSAFHWSKKAEAIGGLTIDAVPTDGSANPVSSNGVFDALAGKANTSALSSYLAKAGGTMTGAITALRETKVAMGANAIDLTAGNLFTKTISGATTLTVSGWLASGNANSFILELTNGGSAVVTWFSGVKWASGTAPTLTASGVDILGFYSHNGGTTVRGILLSKDSK